MPENNQPNGVTNQYQRSNSPLERIVQIKRILKADAVTTRHVPNLEFVSIQDCSEHSNRVMRMYGNLYRRLFPNVQGTHDSVVLKVLDFNNLQEYHDSHRNFEFKQTSYTEVLRQCIESYDAEVECYKRILNYNRAAERHLYAPDLLDYGQCHIYDDHEHTFEGYYMVLEDIKSDAVPSATDEDLTNLLKESIHILASLGIDHGDLSPGNLLLKDGQLYLLDFGQSRFVLPQPLQ